MSSNKFKIGDHVRVIRYGHPYWYKNEVRDTLPEIIGKEGIVAKSETTQGRPTYAVDGIEDKYAWYDEEQLELV